MKPNLILHVGPHKTGTTSVQGALFAARERLRADGILYPESVPGAQFRNQHSDLAFFLRDGRLDACAEYFANLHSQAERAGCGDVLLSGEELSGVALKDALSRLIEVLGADWTVRLLYVRRDVLDLAYSNLVQHLTGELGSFFKWGYDIRRWGKQFVANNRLKEGFFASLPTTFLDLDEAGGQGLANALVEAGTGKRLDYLITGHENSGAVKLDQRADLVLSYPLRMMLGILNSESLLSPRSVAEAEAILGKDLVKADKYQALIERFRAYLRSELQQISDTP